MHSWSHPNACGCIHYTSRDRIKSADYYYYRRVTHHHHGNQHTSLFESLSTTPTELLHAFVGGPIICHNPINLRTQPGTLWGLPQAVCRWAQLKIGSNPTCGVAHLTIGHTTIRRPGENITNCERVCLFVCLYGAAARSVKDLFGIQELFKIRMAWGSIIAKSPSGGHATGGGHTVGVCRLRFGIRPSLLWATPSDGPNRRCQIPRALQRNSMVAELSSESWSVERIQRSTAKEYFPPNTWHRSRC